MQQQEGVTNATFQKAIRLFSQAVTTQVGQRGREKQHEVADNSRIHEF